MGKNHKGRTGLNVSGKSNRLVPYPVIPAKAGIQLTGYNLAN